MTPHPEDTADTTALDCGLLSAADVHISSGANIFLVVKTFRMALQRPDILCMNWE